METLAQAMARLAEEMATLPGVQTFSAKLDNATDFNIVSDAVEEVAKDHDMYIGEKRWINRDTYFELRVGYAEDIEQWNKKYGGLARGRY